MTETDKREAIVFAARVAEQIIARTDDGTKLLSVTYHYPKGWRASEFGFVATSGVITAVYLWLAAMVLIEKLSGVFQ